METRLRALFAWLLERLIGALVLFMVALAFMQVVLRYGFSAAILWVEEISVMALIWLAWLGITYLWLSRSHIAVDLLPTLLPPAGERRLRLAIELLGLLAGATLAFISLETLEMYADMDLGSLEIDASLKYIPVTAGGVGLALAAALNLWRGWEKREAAP